MEPKICPLLSTASDSAYQTCEEERCAWYVPPILRPSGDPLNAGHCAVQLLGLAAPELVRGAQWV